MTLAAALAVAMAGSTNAESVSINASVHVLAISVELDLSAAEARVGDKVRATAIVTNGGAARLSGITVELRVDAAGLRIQGASTTIITRLQPGRTSDSTWTICASSPATTSSWPPRRWPGSRSTARHGCCPSPGSAAAAAPEVSR